MSDFGLSSSGEDQEDEECTSQEEEEEECNSQEEEEALDRKLSIKIAREKTKKHKQQKKKRSPREASLAACQDHISSMISHRQDSSTPALVHLCSLPCLVIIVVTGISLVTLSFWPFERSWLREVVIWMLGLYLVVAARMSFVFTWLHLAVYIAFLCFLVFFTNAVFVDGQDFEVPHSRFVIYRNDLGACANSSAELGVVTARPCGTSPELWTFSRDGFLCSELTGLCMTLIHQDSFAELASLLDQDKPLQSMLHALSGSLTSGKKGTLTDLVISMAPPWNSRAQQNGTPTHSTEYTPWRQFDQRLQHVAGAIDHVAQEIVDQDVVQQALGQIAHLRSECQRLLEHGVACERDEYWSRLSPEFVNASQRLQTHIGPRHAEATVARRHAPSRAEDAAVDIATLHVLLNPILDQVAKLAKEVALWRKAQTWSILEPERSSIRSDGPWPDMCMTWQGEQTPITIGKCPGPYMGGLIESVRFIGCRDGRVCGSRGRLDEQTCTCTCQPPWHGTFCESVD